MSEAQLNILNYALLALLYLFFGRVLWAVCRCVALLGVTPNLGRRRSRRENLRKMQVGARKNHETNTDYGVKSQRGKRRFT